MLVSEAAKGRRSSNPAEASTGAILLVVTPTLAVSATALVRAGSFQAEPGEGFGRDFLPRMGIGWTRMGIGLRSR